MYLFGWGRVQNPTSVSPQLQREQITQLNANHVARPDERQRQKIKRAKCLPKGKAQFTSSAAEMVQFDYKLHCQEDFVLLLIIVIINIISAIINRTAASFLPQSCSVRPKCAQLSFRSSQVLPNITCKNLVYKRIPRYTP